MIGIDNEVLENIQDTAVKAAGAANKVAVVSLPNEPAGVYGLVIGEEFQRVEAQPQPRSITLCSVDQVAEYTVRTTSELKGQPAIYYDTKSVVVVMNDGPGSQRKDRATVILEHTPEFALLKQLGRQTFTQKEFVFLLRSDLAACSTPAVETLIQCCRAIDYRSQKSGSSSVGHGRESLGRDIQEEVISKYGEIPEEVTLSVQVFRDRAMARVYNVTCLVEVDAKSETFQLVPLLDELQYAIDGEMEALGNMLREANCPLHYGRP